MPGALAFRYARALADLASAPAAAVDPEAVTRDLLLFEQTLFAFNALKNALQSPTVPPRRKQAVVTQLAGMLPLSDLVRRFLLVIVGHRRTPLLPDIREAFESVVYERLGVVRVDVASARELAPGQRQELLAELSQLTGKEARARFRVRPELIGGVVARIGSTVYDGSVQGQLETLRQRLSAVE